MATAPVPEKKILGYPEALGTRSKDANGYDVQYIIISIHTDAKASKLRGDKKYSDVFTAQNGSRTTGIGSTEKNTDPDVSKLYGQAEADKDQFVKQKNVVKLDKAIVLPMPNDLAFATSLSYSSVDATLLSKGAEFFQTDNKTGTLKDLATKVKNLGIGAVVNTFKSDATNQRALLAEERKVENPRKEILFDDFGFRRFSFRFTFAPESQKESDIVNQIIETLRFYSLPELSTGKIFYLYPAEFQINFMRGQELNLNIPKIAPCALERVTVNYTPNGLWATLPNAAPVQLDMTLDFLELELIDRTRVYNPESLVTSGF